MESDYTDDDDYAPITVGAWGDQTQQHEQHLSSDDDNSIPRDPTKVDVAAWTQMIDPHAKKRSGALGSGGLHRQGKNYKPVSEEHIIKQRKGVVIPKSTKDKKTRGARPNGKHATSSTDRGKFSVANNTTNATSSFSRPRKSQPATQQQPPPPISTIRRPPPPSSGQSGWGAQPLVETPFWEKQNAGSPPTTSAKRNNNNNWQPTSRDNSNTNLVFESHQPPMSHPPGFGPIPQRQYPTKSNKRSQLAPPPGYSYAEKPAWDANKTNSPPRPWTSNDGDKELWKKMEEGVKLNGDNNHSKPNGASRKDTFGRNDRSSQGKAGSGWGVTNKSNHWNYSNADQGWGSAPDNILDNDDDYGLGDSPQQTPMQFLDQQVAGLTKSRFSNPYKSKFSTTADQDHGKNIPKNYYKRDGTSHPAFIEAPTKVALPPPSHNPVVISIHLELDNGTKIPVPIRKNDRPEELATAFCRSQNITNPTLVTGIANLFIQQKTTAMQRYARSD